MSVFVIGLSIIILVVVFLLFACYDKVFHRSTWREAFLGSSAITLVLAGLIAALAEWS